MDLLQENEKLRGLLRDWMFAYQTGTMGPGHADMHKRTAAALAEPVEPAPAQDEREVAAVIGFYEGEREPRLLSWNVLPNGEHRLYTHPAQTEQQPEQDQSLNMEPEGANAYLVVDPEDNYHICYAVRSKDQALQHATGGLLAFGPITQGGNS